MKVKITIVVFALLSIVMFFFFNIKYPYKENVLYSQNDIKNYDEKQSKSSQIPTANQLKPMSYTTGTNY